MAKIIKPAQTVKNTKTFTVGDQVNWCTRFHDGRSYEVFRHSGKIVKVCPVNLHVEDADGDIWEVAKTEVK